ncbi:hypothetical protein ACFZCU_26070 [Streptomyces canus]|uniref:hypothetical protein n=1 Tax=Streptomyces canus TaxID=58343 RepID=UPI0036E1330F
MSVPLYQAKPEFFRMLGHPVRIRVLESLQDVPLPVRDLLAGAGDVADLLKAAPRILTEVLAGRNEMPAQLRDAEVVAR